MAMSMAMNTVRTPTVEPVVVDDDIINFKNKGIVSLWL
jgi:hypothetical protein